MKKDSATNNYVIISAPVGAFTNCTCGPYFRSPVRGIGSSFQLAITTPRINLIGYGTATAQSWRKLDSYENIS